MSLANSSFPIQKPCTETILNNKNNLVSVSNQFKHCSKSEEQTGHLSLSVAKRG